VVLIYLRFGVQRGRHLPELRGSILLPLSSLQQGLNSVLLRTWTQWVVAKGSKRLWKVSKPRLFFRVSLNFAQGLLALGLGLLVTVVKKRREILTRVFCPQLHLYHLLGQLVGHLIPTQILKFHQPCLSWRVL